MACCGFKDTGDPIPLLSLFLVCAPLSIIGTLLTIVLVPLCVLGAGPRRLLRRVRKLLEVNRSLIDRTLIRSQARCKLASRLFGVSPWLSGAFYKYSNHVVLLVVWTAGVSGVVVVFTRVF